MNQCWSFCFLFFFTWIGTASCYIFLCFKVFNRQVGFDQLMCLFEAGYKSEAEARGREDLFFVTTKVYFKHRCFPSPFLGRKKKDLWFKSTYAISCWLTSHFMLCWQQLLSFPRFEHERSYGIQTMDMLLRRAGIVQRSFSLITLISTLFTSP